MNKLYFVKLNEFGIWEDKIREWDIEKETEKVIFAKEKNSPLRMRVPAEVLTEKHSLYLKEWFIFRKTKEEIIKALERNLEKITKSYKKAINGVEEIG